MSPSGKKIFGWIWKGIGAALIVLAIIWVNKYAAQDQMIVSFTQQFGYLGILAVSAISGFNIFLPIPVIGFYPFFVEVGLHPVLTVVTVTAGMTTGDLVGFLIGHKGRDMVSQNRIKFWIRLKPSKRNTGFGHLRCYSSTLDLFHCQMN